MCDCSACVSIYFGEIGEQAVVRVMKNSYNDGKFWKLMDNGPALAVGPRIVKLPIVVSPK